MSVPYGFSVGDFVAIGTLAWNVYNSCKAAPESFGNISSEVLSFHAVIKETEETIFREPLSDDRLARLKVISDGCESVLKDLDTLLKKHEKLGTPSKRVWDRMRWGAEDIAELRARMISHNVMLSTFIATSQVKVEEKLDEFVDEFRRKQRRGSIDSIASLDSLSKNDRAIWRDIRKQLDNMGISIAAFNANREYIFDWFTQAIDSGAFDQGLQDSHTSNQNCAEEPFKHNVAYSEETSNSNSTEPSAPIAKHSIEGDIDHPSNPDENDPFVGLVSRWKALRSDARIEKQAGKQLQGLVEKKDVVELRKMLSQPFIRARLSDRAMTRALTQAARSDHHETMDILFEFGAPVNADEGQESPLIAAIDGGHRVLVEELISRGASVCHQAQYLRSNNGIYFQGYLSPLVTAIRCGDFVMTRNLILAGADVAQKLWDRGKERFITALHYAADSSEVVLDIILESYVDPDLSSWYGPPLAFAYAGSLSASENKNAAMLIQHGAHPDLDYWDNSMKRYTTSMHVVIACQQQHTLERYLDNGAFNPTPNLLTYAEELSKGVAKLPNVTKMYPTLYKSFPKEKYQDILTLLRGHAIARS